jgi:hypothetical protein
MKKVKKENYRHNIYDCVGANCKKTGIRILSRENALERQG